MLDTAGGSTSAPDGEAAIPVSPSPTTLNLACPCPGTPHEYDSVSFRPHSSIRMGMAASTVMRQNAGDEPAMQAELGMILLRYGIEGWTFTDKDRQPVEIGEPIEPLLLERWLPYYGGGFDALEVANRLYGEEIFRPLVRKWSMRSLPGVGPNSTSATSDSGSRHPTPFKPSSRTRSGAGKRSAGRAP